MSGGKSKDKVWWHHFVAGEVGGMIGAFLCHPFDTAKTRIQMIESHTKQSMFSFMRGIAREEGVSALFRGVLYPFCGFGVIFSVAFGVNGVCQDLLISRKQASLLRDNPSHAEQINSSHLSMSELMLCGALAGLASSTVRTPIERVKVWSQIHGTNTLRSTLDLAGRYGIINGLLFGVNATMGREVPQFAVYYPIYEMTYALLTQNQSLPKSEASGTVIYLSGASAGVGCWIVTYPIDVVKTRLQAAPPGTYRNFAHCARDIYARAGGNVGVFFGGIVPTIYRAAILHSAIFLLYERVVEALGKRGQVADLELAVGEEMDKLRSLDTMGIGDSDRAV